MVLIIQSQYSQAHSLFSQYVVKNFLFVLSSELFFKL